MQQILYDPLSLQKEAVGYESTLPCVKYDVHTASVHSVTGWAGKAMHDQWDTPMLTLGIPMRDVQARFNEEHQLKTSETTSCNRRWKAGDPHMSTSRDRSNPCSHAS